MLFLKNNVVNPHKTLKDELVRFGVYLKTGDKVREYSKQSQNCFDTYADSCLTEKHRNCREVMSFLLTAL